MTGPDAIEKMLSDNVIVYDDGTPRTKHITHWRFVQRRVRTDLVGDTSRHLRRWSTDR